VTVLIVLFNLRDANVRADYEHWARTRDMPTAGALPSVDEFEVLKVRGLLGPGVAPYEYIEILRVNDMSQFAKDVAVPAMQTIAQEFQAFADNPLFIVTSAL